MANDVRPSDLPLKRYLGLKPNALRFTRPRRILGPKGKPAEKTALRLTEQTQVLFSNVAREGARITVGHEVLVSLEPDSQDTAKVVTFVGTAAVKSAEGKEAKADCCGSIVGLSGNGKVLTVELPSPKSGEAVRTEIRLTEEVHKPAVIRSANLKRHLRDVLPR